MGEKLFLRKKVKIFINSSVFVESETSEHPFTFQIPKQSYGGGTKEKKTFLTFQNQKRAGENPPKITVK